MRSRIASWVVVVIGLGYLCVSGLSAQQQTPEDPPPRHRGEGRKYDKNAGFSVVPLKGWKQAKPSYKNVFLNVVGPAESSSPSLNVIMIEDDGTPVERTGEQIKQAWPKQFKEWKCLDEALLTLDGKKAYSIASQCVVQVKDKTVEVRALQYFVVSNKKAYILTYTAVPKVFDSLRKSFEESAQTAHID